MEMKQRLARIAGYSIHRDLQCRVIDSIQSTKITEERNSMAARRSGDLVYSTRSGRICPHCERAAADCICRDSPRVNRGDGIVRVRREVKGRRGKTVTTISGVPLPEDELRALAGDLKRHLGTGGSAIDASADPPRTVKSSPEMMTGLPSINAVPNTKLEGVKLVNLPSLS